MRSYKKVLILCLCAIFAGFSIILLSRNVQGFGQWYALHIFPVFPNTFGRLFSSAPFSVAEMGLYAISLALVCGILYLVSLLLRPQKRYKVRKAASRGLCGFLVLGSFIFLMLAAACTVNYGRDPFAEVAGYKMTASSRADLRVLCELLISDAKTLSGEVQIDENGNFTIADMDIKAEAKGAMKAIGAEIPALSGYYPNPKPIAFSVGMSKINLTGIYSPYTIEANYNDHVADYVIPFTICHELAHLKGFIREDEAGFIAYLACMDSSRPEFRYSGTINALTYALNAYAGEVTREEYGQLYGEIPDQVKRDFAENRAYWKQFDKKTLEIARKANDTYLKANAQVDGVKSYGRMVDLLLARYKIGAEGV